VHYIFPTSSGKFIFTYMIRTVLKQLMDKRSMDRNTKTPVNLFLMKLD
jgi:hypothetical protein